ncbi:uncharacterized protein C1orf21 homolog isoform X1 [Crotalus tigris]|uniref:uncharacterized protein C1orf21 homolog isoform X1 n=1 Tax=Crotalus tigris TaxID=88082 RepID=UPI00192F3045|nr:uncharacterized protein C1orf21 homolog isoform X1 [Crotalus tigris]XP_039213552.1 uncharacterized protein C1orf21 homolog isoform X1 [Crotalus tigris]
MGCASAKHVSAVQNEEEAQKGKNYQNGDVFGDEYRIKPVEEVKYMKNGGEDDQKVAARNQENLEKSASSHVKLKANKELPGLVHQPRAKSGRKIGLSWGQGILCEDTPSILASCQACMATCHVLLPKITHSSLTCQRTRGKYFRFFSEAAHFAKQELNTWQFMSSSSIAIPGSSPLN